MDFWEGVSIAFSIGLIWGIFIGIVLTRLVDKLDAEKEEATLRR